LVSPATFRHPSLLAKMVVTADHVSGGRVELGLGAGWHEAEHRAYGFAFPPQGVRLEMLEEQAEIVHRSWQPGAFDFTGRHYRIEGLEAVPKPFQQPHPNLIIGGRGGARSAAVAARWADEYNTTFASPEECRAVRRRVAEAWEKGGRDPDTLVFSLMTGAVVGRDADDFRCREQAIVAARGQAGSDDAAWLAENMPAWVTGTIDQAVVQLQALAAVGVERVMLQLQQNDDLDMVALLGEIATLVR
jgi:alkanesulfonate monooxygenase SsuD/methylene tetrahydromethanopterin reductase-like flavin-dependent oxidoreductase (luciferase family)